MQLICTVLEKNGLLFLETSALESTNVEAAFNNVLAGKSQCNVYIYIHVYIYMYIYISKEK